MRNLLHSHPLWSLLLDSEPSFAGARRQNLELERYVASITLGKTGKCAEQPALLINLFDSSGSVTGGNDPVGLRFLENWLAIKRVGSRCRCGYDLVAIVHFDPPTSGDLPPTPITSRNRRDIMNSLAVPADGNGSSCLGPALTSAYALPSAYPDHRPILVVHSDFELFDYDMGSVLQQLINFPGDVHAVVLRSPPPPMLVDAPNVTVMPVSHASPPGTVARAVFTALTSERPGAKPLPPDLPGARL